MTLPRASRSKGKRASSTTKQMAKGKAMKAMPATSGGSVAGVPLTPGGRRFEGMRPGIRRLVRQGRWPGVAACVFVGGRLRLLEESGFADVEAKTAMTSKSVVRIYSMTKCVVAVAVLQLADKGTIGLDDKLSDHVPAFASMKVVPEDSAGLPDLRNQVPAKKAITIRHLLTHTSGISSHYSSGIDGPRRRPRRETAWSNLYKDLVEKVDGSELRSLGAWVAELVKKPLWSHPGEHYGYGYSYDILGHIVELKTGRSLASHLREHIFEPLGMRDTRFELSAAAPAAKRLSVLYRYTKSADYGSDGQRYKLVRVDPPRRSAPSLWAKHCALPSGGGALGSLEGGLLTTLDDYTKFLLAGTAGGAHPTTGVRILSKRMAAELLADQTAKLQPRAGVHASPYDDRGLGLSCLGEVQRRRCPEWGQWFDGVPGCRIWGGAGSTAFKYDPNGGNSILAVIMTQAFPQDDGKTISDLLRATRAALADEKGAAASH